MRVRDACIPSRQAIHNRMVCRGLSPLNPLHDRRQFMDTLKKVALAVLALALLIGWLAWGFIHQSALMAMYL